MKFGTYFRASSYAMIASGALALVAAGGIGPVLTLVSVIVMLAAWKAEGTRWRLSERLGLGIVLLSLPLFYVDWQYLLGTGLARERVGVTALAHLILFLSGVKLVQEKGDRDWVFLYLISFFEVLLAAGLSISPLFFGALMVYILCALNTIVAFEMQKASRAVNATETRLSALPGQPLPLRLTPGKRRNPIRRLPLLAGLLLALILVLATPIFFMMPRFNSATFARTNGGLSGFSGFSDVVRLGDVGRLQLSDEVVMRVRVENGPAQPLRWRGVALDEFTGKVWRKSKVANPYPYSSQRNESGFFAVDSGPRQGRPLTTQTFYLEPMDTAVIFAAPRVVAVQGAMTYLRMDAEGSLTTREHDFERISYRIFSDIAEPDAALLNAEQPVYGPAYQRYRQLPENLDPRFKQLAQQVLDRAKPRSMYDAARALETRLRQDYGYSLEMKATGDDPLADFLFNVRAGHCEYFASSLVILLRTQGIAARIVNGFQTGAYNGAADAYTVTQRDAHSWVEVYFPQNNVWVTFDPTPAAGQPNHTRTGFAARLGQYSEALEMLWIQYVVAYDKAEQRSLTATAAHRFEDVRNRINRLYETAAKTLAQWRDAWQRKDGDNDTRAATRRRMILTGAALALSGIFLVLMARWAWRRGWGRYLFFWRRQPAPVSVVEFYERMIKALARQGRQRAAHETPLEFAVSTGQAMPLKITDAYHRVRYGAQPLGHDEAAEIETWLRDLEKPPKP